MDRLNSIVVGVDFSPSSATALKQAIRIARWHRAKLHVVHVIDTLVVMDLGQALDRMQQSIQDGLVRDARAAWDAFRRNIAGAEEAEFEVEIDNRLVTMLRQIKKHEADLLVIGAHAQNEPDAGTGPLATACVRRAPCTVLLVRDQHDGPFKNIVACVDFSDTSRQALEDAARVSTQDSAKLYVLHVFRPPWRALPFRTEAAQVDPVMQERYRDDLRRRLVDAFEPLRHEMNYLKPAIDVVEHPKYGEGINEFARSVNADLVVVGNRGRSNLRYVLLGSTAEKVVRYTPSSVLVVKPPGLDQPPDSETAALDG